ncbi:MAG: methyl-accepting chemotaxis protein [Desulfocapsa sp.]|nr:methyl-accepting chemotaxis protein [Desulfocapsa sp.]
MAKEKTVKFKRRQYFINRKFQTGFILKFLLVLVFGAILSVIITMLTTGETLTSSFEGSRLVIEKTSLAILPSVIFTNMITTTVIGILAVVVTLLASHKIAGPMFRFERDLEEISQGDLKKHIHIRTSDQFGSVAESLNEMVESLNGRLCEIKQDLERVSEAASIQKLPQVFLDDLEECRRKIDSKFKL